MSELEHYTGDDWEDPLCNYEPPEYADALEEALAEEMIAELKSKPYAEIPSDKSVHGAIQALSGLKVASLMVIEEGRLVGVFTERDVLEKVSTRFDEVKDLPVCEVMTANPIVVYETDPVATALSAIAAAGYRRVPVLDINEKVVGVISPRRVFSFLQDHFAPKEAQPPNPA